MRYIYKIMICVMLLINNSDSYISEIFVDTNIGRIYGLKGLEFTSFLGIPYGKVDETDYFAPATAYPAFKAPYNATKPPEICPQIVGNTTKGSLHCLSLNVYVPNHINASSAYPVMVYIHGGAFIEGDGNKNTYSPKFLMKHDVIIVSINYRLGIYGFLCLKNTEYNNIGIKDQVLALKWVKDNINAFGGNDSDITLVGHSAGGVSVDIHLLFNKETVFNKAVIQSAVAGSPIVFGEVDNHLLNKIAKKVKFNGDINDVNAVIKYLSGVDVGRLIEASKMEAFRPCIDGNFITVEPKNKAFDDMKIIVGYTTKEFSYFYPDSKEFYDSFDIKSELGKSFRNVSNEMVKFVKNFYREDAVKDEVCNFGMDFGLLAPIDRTVKYYLDNNVTVFMYEFSYKGKRNLVDVRDRIKVDGATHGDELGYLFDMKIFDDLDVDDDDRVMIDRMTSMWTNFAKYGDPSLTTPDLTLRWPPLTRDAKPLLVINTTFKVTNKQKPSITFWELYYRMFEKQISNMNLMKTTPDDYHMAGPKKYSSKFYFVLMSFACVCLNIFLLNVLLVMRAFRQRQ